MTKAEKCIRFIEALKVPKGKAGNTLFKLQQWQKDFILKLFDTLRADGLRAYRTALLLIPKKNGKTTLAAAISIFCLFCENEIGGEIYSVANTRDQASICFNAAAQMIRTDPYLSSQCKILDSKKRIIYPRTNSVYEALSADAGDKNGKNPSIIIYDEICEAPADGDLYEKLQSGTASRQQPLMLAISTAGDKKSIGHQLYEHAVKVRDGIIDDPTFLPVIYEATAEDDHNAEATWIKANPSWGVTVEPEFMRQAIIDAANMPTRLNQLLRYHLNVWVDRNTAWIPSAKWSACSERYDLASLAGRPCYVAVDLSSTIDITAVVLLFRLDDGKYAVVCRFYLPRAKAMERYRLDRVPYPSWIQQGFITPTDTDVVDYDVIRKDITDLGKLYDIRGIAIDRWNANQLSTQLEADGFKVEKFGMGFGSMNAPSKEFEKLIIGRKILHNDQPVLRWMASNVVAEIDAAGNIKPSKKRSPEKIDGIVALLMALGIAILKGDDDGKSVYQTRGVLRM